MDLTEAKKYKIAPWEDTQIVREDFHVVVYKDKYPVTPGHLLFVPVYDTEHCIRDALMDAYQWGMKMVENKECDGFNIGMNFGEAAGQTVMFPHIHLIPRNIGDMEDPRGGVRHVIPEKGNYKK
jgi:diadenosine tetraphosphate (Ap4A) HIT family hydrolase